MAVNPFFDRLEAHNEQALFSDLVDEDIQISGFDITYIHRSEFAVDEIFTEAKASKFKDSFVIEASISDNVTGWQGTNEFMNQFGLNIDNTGSIKISQRRWQEAQAERASQGLKVLERPLEGDLVYFGYGHATFTNNLFIINHVDFADTNWQHGRAFLYRLQVTNYTPNYNEKIETSVFDSIPELTEQFAAMDYYNDLATQNQEVQDKADTLVKFDEKNPFGGT